MHVASTLILFAKDRFSPSLQGIVAQTHPLVLSLFYPRPRDLLLFGLFVPSVFMCCKSCRDLVFTLQLMEGEYIDVVSVFYWSVMVGFKFMRDELVAVYDVLFHLSLFWVLLYASLCITKVRCCLHSRVDCSYLVFLLP